jgi:hypothetical protein
MEEIGIKKESHMIENSKLGARVIDELICVAPLLFEASEIAREKLSHSEFVHISKVTCKISAMLQFLLLQPIFTIHPDLIPEDIDTELAERWKSLKPTRDDPEEVN